MAKLKHESDQKIVKLNRFVLFRVRAFGIRWKLELLLLMCLQAASSFITINSICNIRSPKRTVKIISFAKISEKKI